MTDPAFLGVECSLSDRRWIGPGAETIRHAEAISQISALPDALSRILAARGVLPEDVQNYLDPRLRDLLPNPMSLKDMGVAADRLITALEAKQKIAIFADYDVDGGASAATPG